MNEHLRAFAPSDKSVPLSVDLAGITYPDPNYHIVRKKSDLFVIEYITDGEGYVFFDGETNRLGKDTVYLLRQGERHEYYADKKNPFTKIFLNVTGSMCNRLLLEYGLSQRHSFDGANLKPVFERIVSVIDSDQPEYEIQAALQGIFLEIISNLSSFLTINKHSTEALELKNYLDSNLDRLISAQELAGTIFRSKDYCQKLFYREFGITPYAYQLDRKIQTARAMLINTRMSIREIAEAVGYNDIHYFSNLFLKKCGQRPSSYRKNRS